MTTDTQATSLIAAYDEVQRLFIAVLRALLATDCAAIRTFVNEFDTCHSAERQRALCQRWLDSAGK